MTRVTRTFIALMFGSSLLLAQLPNPLGLPDPLGVSRSPAPRQAAPRSHEEGRRVERRPRREKQRDQGKHKGHDKRGKRDSGKHKGHDNH
jgi:hypothetical protein